MSAIFTRYGLYLNAFYQWGVIPHLFPEWQVSAVLDLTEQWKDKPEGFAMVAPGVIDLDGLKLVML